MRKDTLKKLLAMHSNPQTKTLTKLLEKDYAEYANHHNITFAEVAGALQKDGHALADIPKIKAENHREDTDLFYLFITGKPFHEVKPEETKPESRPFDKNRDDAVDNSFPPYLEAKDIVNLSSVSFSLYQRTVKPAYWKDKLLALGCDKEVLHKVISTKVIENYKTLYHTLLHFDYESRKSLSAWELYYLSGESKSLVYADQYEDFTQNLKRRFGQNALHWAAWSGSVEAMKYTIEVLKIAPDSCDNNDRNALHFAAWGGSVEAMKYAIEALKIRCDSRDNERRNAVHFAAESGCVAAMKYAIEALKMAHGSRNNDARNTWRWALKSGSVAAMRYAIEVCPSGKYA